MHEDHDYRFMIERTDMQGFSREEIE